MGNVAQRVTMMKVFIVGRWQLVTSLLGAILIVAIASTAGAQTVEEVIAKNIKAQGGREALLGLKSVERKGSVSVDGAFGQMEGSVEEAVIPWKKTRRALDLAVFVQTDGYNGKAAWRENMEGVKNLEGEEAAQIKRSIDLNPLVTLKERELKAEKLADETVDNVAYFVIQLTAKEKPPVKLYINKETNLLNRTTVKQTTPQFGEVDVVIENTDYQEFGPVKLPTKSKITLGEALTILTTYTETKVNGKVDEAIFEKPAEEAAK
jgi:hypothetical protein